VLEGLVAVADGARVSDLERWRKGPVDPSGRNLQRALQRAAEIHGVEIAADEVRALVPARRLVDLARYGMAARRRGCGAIPRRGGWRRCWRPWWICSQARSTIALSRLTC